MEKICRSRYERVFEMIKDDERHLRIKDLGARVDFFPIPIYCLYLIFPLICRLFYLYIHEIDVIPMSDIDQAA